MDSQLTCSDIATLQFGVASSDGRLSANQDSLIFEPLNKLVGFGPYRLARQDIRAVRRQLLRKRSINNQVQTAVEIELVSGEIYQFIVAEPDKWLKLLSRNSNIQPAVHSCK